MQACKHEAPLPLLLASEQLAYDTSNAPFVRFFFNYICLVANPQNKNKIKKN